MGVVLKPLHQLLDVLVQQRVLRDLVGPGLELLFGGQLSEEDQVRGFEIGAVLGQFLDGIPAIPEDALVAVDIGNRAPAGRGVEEGRVVGRQPRVVNGLDLLEIGGPNRAFLDGDFVLLARAVVGNRQRVSHKRATGPSRRRPTRVVRSRRPRRARGCLFLRLAEQARPARDSCRRPTGQDPEACSARCRRESRVLVRARDGKRHTREQAQSHILPELRFWSVPVPVRSSVRSGAPSCQV